MEPAQTIIKRLGGPTAVAAALGLHRTRVSAWQRSRDSGGTSGQIPQKHFDALLQLADEQKVQLAPHELVAVRRPRSRPLARRSGSKPTARTSRAA